MRLVLLASGAFALPTIRRFALGEFEIALIVTQPARGSGRGRHPTPTPVKTIADELGLPVVEVENVNIPEFVAKVRSLDARVMLAIAFGQKLGPEFLVASRGGAINLHASLLPKYRGAAPINWAVAQGERETGNTVFRIVSRMDAGPILAQQATPIGPDETTGELHDRLAELGVQTVRDALAMFVDDTNPTGTPQDDAQASLAPKLKKSDGFIDFAQPVQRVADCIRGMTPWPGATAKYVAADGRAEIVTIARARPVADSMPIAPPPPKERHRGVTASPLAKEGLREGTASPLAKGGHREGTASPLAKGGHRGVVSPGVVDDDLRIAAADGSVEIVQIKPASGRTMDWADFVNGRHVMPGDRFESPI